MALGKLVQLTPGRKLMFKKKTKTAMTTAKKALRIAKANRTFEVLKYNDVNVSMTASAVPTVVFLQPPTCDGEKQTIQNIEARMFIRQNLASVLVDNYRVDLVLDRYPSGVALDLSKLYEDATPRITALLSYDMRDRYKIVKSYSCAFSENSNTSRMINFKVRSGLVCEADGQTPSQANIQKNAYYLVFWTESTANTPIITYDIQIDSITA